MSAFKTAILLLLISASLISAAPNNREARGVPCIFLCTAWDTFGISTKPLLGHGGGKDGNGDGKDCFGC